MCHYPWLKQVLQNVKIVSDIQESSPGAFLSQSANLLLGDVHSHAGLYRYHGVFLLLIRFTRQVAAGEPLEVDDARTQVGVEPCLRDKVNR